MILDKDFLYLQNNLINVNNDNNRIIVNLNQISINESKVSKFSLNIRSIYDHIYNLLIIVIIAK